MVWNAERQMSVEDQLLRVAERHRRENAAINRKLLEQIRALSAKHRLEIEVEELKGIINVMGCYRSDADALKIVEKMTAELQIKRTEFQNKSAEFETKTQELKSLLESFGY